MTIIHDAEIEFAKLLGIDAERLRFHIDHAAGPIFKINGQLGRSREELLAACQVICEHRNWHELELLSAKQKYSSDTVMSPACSRCRKPMKRMDFVDKHGDWWLNLQCYNPQCLFAEKAVVTRQAMEPFELDRFKYWPPVAGVRPSTSAFVETPKMREDNKAYDLAGQVRVPPFRELSNKDLMESVVRDAEKAAGFGLPKITGFGFPDKFPDKAAADIYARKYWHLRADPAFTHKAEQARLETYKVPPPDNVKITPGYAEFLRLEADRRRF